MDELSTRERITAAAVASANDVGWDQMSMQTVRTRAGVSNGSLFHFFPTRQALTSAVLASGLDDHQRRLVAVLDSTTDARRGVRAVVVEHLAWMWDNPALTRLFLTTPPAAVRATADGETVAGSRVFFAAVTEWLTDRGWTGRVGLPVVLALWVGPAQEYARRADLSAPTDTKTVNALRDGSWRALQPLITSEGR